jgi:universal stress protein A
MAYQHVLTAVDLPEESAQVLDKARLEADRHGARLSLVTVVKPLTHVYGGIDVAPLAGSAVSFEEQAIEQAKHQLHELAVRCGVAADNVHVLLGAPAYDIRELAGRLGVDLIVIGTHGRHGVGLLLGSTASALLHGVERDVLAVRVRVGEGQNALS